jgi:hypothetical protein
MLSDYLAPGDSNARLGGFMGKPLPNFLRGKEIRKTLAHFLRRNL